MSPGLPVGATYPLLQKAWELAVRVQERSIWTEPLVADFRDRELRGADGAPRPVHLLRVREWIEQTAAADGHATSWMAIRVYQGQEGGPPLDADPFGQWEQDYVEYWALSLTRPFLDQVGEERAGATTEEERADVFRGAHDRLFKGEGLSPPALERVPVRRGGVLDRLRRAAERLHQLYGWHPADAATCILTVGGFLPSAPPLVEAKTEVPIAPGALWHINLRVHPSVPPTSVAAGYRQERAKALAGTRERLPSTESLELAGFLLDKRDTPEWLTWQRQMEAWNTAHPERPYLDRRLFWRDSKRVMRAIEDLARGPKRVTRKGQDDGEARE